MTMFYDDDGTYAIDTFDQVVVSVLKGNHRFQFDGVVTKLHPRLKQVTVRYEDDWDCYRTTGNPRIRSGRFGMEDVELIARDG